MIETDVLVVGSGPAGSASAALLAMYGVPHILVTKYGWLADTPRAHITNQRTMEVLRDLGIEDEAIARSSPQELMANNVFCTSLAGEELGRLYSWGNHPRRKADYALASPTRICDVPQDLMEPILLGAAGRRGSTIRMSTELTDLVQDAAGVTATVRDRVKQESYQIRAKYLIGADGGKSRIAELVGLPFDGQLGVAGSMNIVFEADLTRFVAHRPSVLYWVLQPGANIGGIGAGLVRMVRPWNQWLIVWGYDITAGEKQLGEDEAIAIVRNLVGDPDLAVTDQIKVDVDGEQPVRGEVCERSRVLHGRRGPSPSADERARLRTPRSKTRTTCAGSSRTSYAVPRARRCSRATTPSANRSANRS